MVNLGNSIDSQNNSGSSTVTIPRHLLIMQKLRAARLKDSGPQQVLENSTKKQTLPKTDLKLKKQMNLSTSSFEQQIELLKRSTVQEKIFKMQCEMLRTKNFNSSHTSDLELHTRRRHSKLSMEDDNDVNNTPMAGVLHLKEPIVNGKNENIYYENRGRMDPIDWSILDKSEGSSGKKNSNKENINSNKLQNKSGESNDRIEDISQNKPEPCTEFLNFVRNCTSDKTVYEVQGNVKYIHNATIDSPILKLQRMINNSNQNDLRLNQKIKQAFEPAQPTLLIIDQIDSQINELNSVQNVNSKLNKVSKDEKTSDDSIDKKDSLLNKLKSLRNKMKTNLQRDCDFESEDNMSMLAKTNASLKNVVSKKGINEYNDDIFNFVKPTSSQNSTSSSFHSCDEIHSIDSIISTESHKLIKCSTEKSNTSFDSNDTFLERSSEFEDTSFSSKSNVSKNFESFRRRLTSTSTQYIPKSDYNTVHRESSATQNHVCNEIKSENGEFLMRESITRYFKNCNSEGTETEKNNIIELVNIKTTSNYIPMLKEVSTRYFSKQNAQHLSQNKSKVDESSEPFESSEPSVSTEHVKYEAMKIEKDSDYQLKDSEQSIATMNDAKLKGAAEYEESLDLLIETINDTENIPKIKEKTYGEACIISINQQNALCETNTDSIGSASTGGDSDYEIIFHTHTDSMDNFPLVQEIHLDSENVINNKDSTSNTLTFHTEEDSEKSVVVHKDEDSEKNLTGHEGKDLEEAIHENTDCEKSTAVHKDKDSENNSSIHEDEDSENNSSIHENEVSEKRIAVHNNDNFKNNSATEEDKDSKANFADFEGIEPDEEFDIVNLEEFAPFTALVNRLQGVQALQKAHAAGLLDEDNKSLSITETEETNNNSENKSKSLITSRSNESSLNISDNNYSSICASISSNLDTDNENTINLTESPNLLTNESKSKSLIISRSNESSLNISDNNYSSINASISSNLDTDNENTINLTESPNLLTNDDRFNCNFDNDNTPKFSTMITRKNETTGLSKKVTKMTNALKMYQQNHKNKDTGEGNEIVQQQLDNATKNENVNTSDYVKHRILKEIKKHKLHLMCKPMAPNPIG